MSMICGIINIDGNPISEYNKEAMMNSSNLYKFDVSKTWYDDGVFFGASIKYDTQESRDEVLPYYDSDAKLAITADAIIDNRDELYSLLNIPIHERKTLTDSQLILLSYKKWREECPRYLVGDFAFSIWDSRNKQLFCARDHVGKRTLYFFRSRNTFAFCTLMKPLLSIDAGKSELNERWIADFLALETVDHEISCNETIYKDIYQLPPATSISNSKEGLKDNIYWNPLEQPELKYKTDNEYKEAFREIFSEAVSCRLRSCGSVGIMLSGGLDSGSIACLAASELSSQNKRLKAYCSIPMTDYSSELPEYFIPDERAYVQSILDHNNNIDINYCRCDNKNSLTDIDLIVNILEQPYKIVENIFWYNEIAKKAGEDGCSILLDGQYGNSTISFGDFFTHILTLYRKGKFISMIKEVKGYTALNQLPISTVIKDIIKVTMPYNFRKRMYDRQNSNYNKLPFSPINTKLLKKWNVNERLDEKGYNFFPRKYFDLSEVRKFIVDPAGFTHLGAIETKISLANGVAKRDPTRDKRVIEFCLRVPGEQYVKMGEERSLIRRGMEGILPDEIRLNTLRRGIQSADWVQRIIPQWDNIIEQLQSMINDKNTSKYLDVEKLRKAMPPKGRLPDWEHRYLIRMLLISLIFTRFLDIHNPSNK